VTVAHPRKIVIPRVKTVSPPIAWAYWSAWAILALVLAVMF